MSHVTCLSMSKKNLVDIKFLQISQRELGCLSTIYSLLFRVWILQDSGGWNYHVNILCIV